VKKAKNISLILAHWESII